MLAEPNVESGANIDACVSVQVVSANACAPTDTTHFVLLPHTENVARRPQGLRRDGEEVRQRTAGLVKLVQSGSITTFVGGKHWELLNFTIYRASVFFFVSWDDTQLH